LIIPVFTLKSAFSEAQFFTHIHDMDLRLMTENATHNLTAVGKSIKLEINA